MVFLSGQTSCSRTEGRRQMVVGCAQQVTAKVRTRRKSCGFQSCSPRNWREELPEHGGGDHPCRDWSMSPGSDHNKWDKTSCHGSARRFWSPKGWRQSRLTGTQASSLNESQEPRSQHREDWKHMGRLHGACVVGRHQTAPPPPAPATGGTNPGTYGHIWGEIRIQLHSRWRWEQSIQQKAGSHQNEKINNWFCFLAWTSSSHHWRSQINSFYKNLSKWVTLQG